VNIGHSLVCYALEMGMDKAVRKMKEVLLYSRRSR
jgi:pyridoxine 5'-phosphate synthase PdxJ